MPPPGRMPHLWLCVCLRVHVPVHSIDHLPVNLVLDCAGIRSPLHAPRHSLTPPLAQPNLGFRSQLIEYEAELRGSTTMNAEGFDKMADDIR